MHHVISLKMQLAAKKCAALRASKWLLAIARQTHRLLFKLNAFWHKLHSYGSSPVCVHDTRWPYPRELSYVFPKFLLSDKIG